MLRFQSCYSSPCHSRSGDQRLDELTILILHWQVEISTNPASPGRDGLSRAQVDYRLLVLIPSRPIPRFCQFDRSFFFADTAQTE